MKTYQTKTGIPLTVIQGEGRGNGIPCGSLRVVQPQERQPVSILDGALITVSRPVSYANPHVTITVKVPRVSYDRNRVGGLVVECSNYLFRRYGLNAHNPTVGGLKTRSRKGFKTLCFEYEIPETQAKRLGFKDNYGEMHFLQKNA